MNKRIGILDIGSNSVRLLVADISDGQVFSVHQEKITSRLLAGFQNGLLHESAIERTARAIEVLSEKARALGADEVAGFGTSAMRDGINREQLVERAAALGVGVDVMSGEEEARLAYAGAAPRGQAGVIDIGGGSTELLVGEDGRVTGAYSVKMGAVRLFEILEGRMDRSEMLLCARAALAEAGAIFLPPAPSSGWTGVGGTLTALASMSLALKTYDPQKIEGYALTSDAVCEWLTRLTSMSLGARRSITGLNPERADIIPYGAAILAAFFELSGATHVSVSDRDNLLGYIQTNFVR